MNFGEKVFALLCADPAVAAIVGTRIHPNVAPQGGTLPVVVYSVISDVPVSSLGGWTSALTRARVQIDCYAAGYREAQALADAVSLVLGARVEAPSFASAQVMRRDLYEDSTGEHRVSLDFSMFKREE